MRIERRGGAPNLEEAFEHLIVKRLNGRSLDDDMARESSKGKYPDFACFREIVLIEMKHLETDQNDRLNSALEEMANPDEKPLFYGTRDADLIIKSLSNASEIERKFSDKLGQTIGRVLQSANKQLGDYRKRNPRKNEVNICVILNSTIQVYSPEIVVHAIHRKMAIADRRQPLFPSIDAILYISEKHATRLVTGQLAFPIAIYEGAGAIENPWKTQFVDRIVSAWSSHRTGGAPFEGSLESQFEPLHDIPERMSRSDLWYLEYERSPYLKDVSDEDLKVIFARNIGISSINLVKGEWPKLPDASLRENMRRFAHIIAETNRRGIDLRGFSPAAMSPNQIEKAYKGLPPELIDILLGR